MNLVLVAVLCSGAVFVLVPHAHGPASSNQIDQGCILCPLLLGLAGQVQSPIAAYLSPAILSGDTPVLSDEFRSCDVPRVTSTRAPPAA
ncbi:MAG: hypothetical protein AAB353_03945 [Candidatus Hydrogenedentota bacterium]